MKTALLMSVLALSLPAGASIGTGATEDLRSLAAAGRLDELRWPVFSDVQRDVIGFYGLSGYAPVWTRNGAATPQALALVAALEHADQKGLDARDYDGGRWQARLARLDTETERVHFGLALTVSAMRYVAAIRYGRANPDKHRDDLAPIVWHLIDSSSVSSNLERQEPPYAGYRFALTALELYRRLAENERSANLPATKKPVDPGSSYAGIPSLAERLSVLGDLPPDAAASADSQDYRGPLVDAVKHFQLRHGLDADGRLGAKTLAELNTPLSFRIRQLELALERWRWVPREFARPPIVVNIPEFRLRVLDSSFRTALEMKVVTGKAGRLHTPIFSASLQYVIFRPYWNVPYDIQRRELVPAIEKDPQYLEKNGYEVVTPQGQVVTNEIVTEDVLAQLRRGRLHIRQVPGPKNALGAVKFMLPNDNDVYLHDTPARQLFAHSRRDFSHGCIRVENALDLAAWVLRDQPLWTRDKMQEAMNGEKSMRADLTAPIPVLVVYATAVAHADGTVSFLDDIYGMDAALQKQIESGVPYSDAAATSGGLVPRPRG
jgi:murein L,D-transpeptidase YcbB/YkuD